MSGPGDPPSFSPQVLSELRGDALLLVLRGDLGLLPDAHPRGLPRAPCGLLLVVVDLRSARDLDDMTFHHLLTARRLLPVRLLGPLPGPAGRRLARTGTKGWLPAFPSLAQALLPCLLD